jgi:GNAT superfamily N-acetyltransferase
MTITIRSLNASDRADWEPLARGYKAFYNTPTTDAEFETAWQRLIVNREVHALVAELDGEIVGIAHFLFHTSVWTPKVCYLQDLFTSPEARGKGVARALIEAVASAARTHGATRYYWLTQEHNATARVLYDRIGKFHGFIRYDYALG